VADRRPRSSSLTPHQARRKEQILTQHEPTKIRQSADAIVLKEGKLFLLTTEAGDVPWSLPHGFGLFLDDCRFLDGYLLSVNDTEPTVLSADDTRGFETHHYLTNPALGGERGPAISKSTVTITRHRIIRDAVLHELIALQNYGAQPARLRVELRFRAAFQDLFVLKGFVTGPRGRLRKPRVRGGDAVELAYEGRDGMVRLSELVFAPRPTRLAGDAATFEIRLERDATCEVSVRIAPVAGDGARPRRAAAHPATPPAEIRRWLRRSERVWLEGSTEVGCSNPLFERILQRALLDLRMLRSRIDGDHFFAAGVPWFGTLFGRDAATVALQTLPYGPAMARQTLRLLARFQATTHDAYRDAEPGKILHELRRGELARLGAIPQSPAYYGTLDATLLFVVLAGEYVAWSGDLALVRELREAIERALTWMTEFADHDGDGYLDYTGRYAHGLVNQGWKDSGNAIVNADGSLAEPPIALAEVQAYAHLAWGSAAALMSALGDAERGRAYRRRASELQARFERDFWDDALGCYVMARQAGGRPVAVVSSNAGQVLWGGIASPARAGRVAARLMEDDMFSGWGIRTLSASAAAYNPVSYHLGSVWPHDNALILAGFRRYGEDERALRLFDALFEAASRFRSYRLPELYCGYARHESEDRPVRYPVACSPQAWASGAIPHALWSLLGLRPDALARRLEVRRPRLPTGIEWLELRRLRVGPDEVDLRFAHRGDGEVSVDVKPRSGDLEVRRTEDRP
jgi:glycogen debranching enzyme